MRVSSLALVFVAAVSASTGAGAVEQDGSRARVVEQARREQARLRSMDVNNDGIITPREWRGGAAAFRQLDTDGDRQLRGREIWFRLPDDSSSYTEEDQRREDMIEAFHRADRNRDGRLARAEWWSQRNVFDRIDGNRDAILTLGEFLYTEEAIDVPTGTTGDTSTQSRAYKSGYQRGLVEGRQAGKEDKALRNQWDLDGQSELEQADLGYTSDLGPRTDYQAGYRAGFRLGYKQGFGPRF